MVENFPKEKDNFGKLVLDFCRHIASSYEIVAVCQSHDYTIQAPTANSTVEVLLVIKNFQPRLMTYVRFIVERNVIFFVVDEWIFERDVDRGLLGEALASRLIFPYLALQNKSYLWSQEIILKKRLVLELIENAILGYPELSSQMRFKPEYFIYEVMLSRVRVFPPIAQGATHLLCGDTADQDLQEVQRGFSEALNLLEKEDAIRQHNGYITITEKYASSKRNRRANFTNIIKAGPRALFSSLFGVFPQFLTLLAQNSEALFRFQAFPWKREVIPARSFVDPKNYVFVPTSSGKYVSLAEKVDITGYAKHILKKTELGRVKCKRYGGVLNDIYLIKASTKSSEQKVLVKQYRDISSMKWFPLSIWSIGAYSFALMGKPRLEREVAINQTLAAAGFHVPKILHVSPEKRLVFMEFLEGENFAGVIKRIIAARSAKEASKGLALVAQVGETYAKVHEIGVFLGDTKPENIMVDKQRNLYMLDFEQASGRSGDKSWDVACFLYYCGHYVPLGGEDKAEAIAKSFIEGYLKAGGKAEVLKCAGIPKYTRVFSIFTLPLVLRAMSKECKELEGPRCKKWL